MASCLDQGLGALHLFTAVVTRDDVERGKPDPEGHLLACRLLDCDPMNAIAVEDAPAGVSAAATAGVGRVVGLTSTFTAAHLRGAGATHVVTRLSEVLQLLR